MGGGPLQESNHRGFLPRKGPGTLACVAGVERGRGWGIGRKGKRGRGISVNFLRLPRRLRHIVGFHMTSLKVKLQNCIDPTEILLSWCIRASEN